MINDIDLDLMSVNNKPLFLKLEYGGFEGNIPKGLYGAGDVSIWDRGFYVPVQWLSDKIEIVLAGERLKGRYELIRFEKAGEKEWLIFKKKS